MEGRPKNGSQVRWITRTMKREKMCENGISLREVKAQAATIPRGVGGAVRCDKIDAMCTPVLIINS